jgi:hypothetical protein
MELEELHFKLKELGIPETDYYLHGLYGSTDNNDKVSLTIRRGKYGLEYEVYFKERGSVHSRKIFFNKDEACLYIYQEFVKSIEIKDKYSLN